MSRGQRFADAEAALAGFGGVKDDGCAGIFYFIQQRPKPGGEGTANQGQAKGVRIYAWTFGEGRCD